MLSCLQWSWAMVPSHRSAPVNILARLRRNDWARTFKGFGFTLLTRKCTIISRLHMHLIPTTTSHPASAASERCSQVTSCIKVMWIRIYFLSFCAILSFLLSYGYWFWQVPACSLEGASGHSAELYCKLKWFLLRYERVQNAIFSSQPQQVIAKTYRDIYCLFWCVFASFCCI